MPIETFGAALKFVNLVLKYLYWSHAAHNLPEEETLVILTLLRAAGFNTERVLPGGLPARGSKKGSGDVKHVNSNCPFKVIGQDGNADYEATAWLDNAFKIALKGGACDQGDSAREIERQAQLHLEAIQASV